MTLDINKPLVELASGPLSTEYGDFLVKILSDGNVECTVAIKGIVEDMSNVLCRIHSSCICSHVLYSTECDCSKQMRKAMKRIDENGQGILVLLDQEGRGNGSAAHIATQLLKREGMSQDEAYEQIGFPPDNRDYRIVAKVIKHLNIRSIILLSSSNRKKSLLEQYGAHVTKLSARDAEVTILGVSADNFLAYQRRGHHIGIEVGNGKRKMLVVGDLCLDYVLYHSDSDSEILDLPEPELGGTAVSASIAFSKKEELSPILVGRVGNDPDGRFVQDLLSDEKITALIGRDQLKRSGVCIILYDSEKGKRIMIKSEINNANDYSIADLQQAIAIAELNEIDFVFVVCHFLVRSEIEKAREILETLSSSKAKVILDLVPHNMYLSVSESDFAEFLKSGVFCIISEYETIAKLHGISVSNQPTSEDIEKLSALNSDWLVLRYGDGNCDIEQVLMKSNGNFEVVSRLNTGYSSLAPSARKGFGDKLTAELVTKYFCNSNVSD